MKRHIRIGYLGRNRSWEQLLGQIGVSWDRITPAQPLTVENYSCVIVDHSLDRADQSNLDQYLQTGGAVLDAAGSYYPGPVQQTSISVINPKPGDTLFGHVAEIPVYGQALTLASSGLLDGTVHIEYSSNRNLAFCGLPVHRLWQEFQHTHKLFGTKQTAITMERVSSLRSHPYFEVVLTLLKVLHDRSGLPFVHTWWHPDPDKHAATCRIDSDYGDLNTMSQLSDSAWQANIPMTWFLHTAHHADQLSNLIKTIPDSDEISLHCYRHFEYKTKEQYRSDISEGIKMLKQSGSEPKGYAAPYGSWTEPLARALSHFPFQYTSEFSYDYDSLPSTSPASAVLQLPIHPVSVGSFSRFDASPSEIQEYFNQITKFKRLTHQPLHLYHHPNDGTPKQFTELLQLADHGRYHWMTYSEWAEWWTRRSALPSVSMFDSDTGKLHFSNSGTAQVPVAIHHQDRVHISVISDPTVWLEELPFRPYIDPTFKTFIETQTSDQSISWFRRKKDQWLTKLWRNRA